MSFDGLQFVLRELSHILGGRFCNEDYSVRRGDLMGFLAN